MAHTAKSSKLLRFSLAAFALSGGGFGAGCSGTDAGSESDSNTSGSASSALVVSPDLVISQVYGGGGNSLATYTHDFIELFNRGTTSVSLSGKSIQYASSTGKFSNAANIIALPSASVAPGSYYLIQLASAANVGSALPTPDLVTTGTEAIGLANSKAKIALVDSASLLNACGDSLALCTDGAWIDLVSYGASSQSETSPTAATSNTTAAIRKSVGCVDTGNNSADFDVATPTPRNSATTAVNCANVPQPVDAGPPDTGTPIDSGVVVDAGGTDSSVGTDAGKIDSGVKTDGGVRTDGGAKTDAGTAADDAGTAEEDDAGTTAPPKDAGAAKKDSGAPKSSSSTTTTPNNPDSGGCSVSATPTGASGATGTAGLAFFGLALAALTRRRKA